jgi:ATP-binding protein involved in chromosome partitioning
MATEAQIREALGHVQDPELGKDLVSLGMVKGIQVEGGKVTVQIELTTPACPLKARIQEDCTAAIRAVEGVQEVVVEMGARTRGVKSGNEEAKDYLPGVKNIVIVASGKGGVGKSSIAINLAAALAKRGAVTGLLDADLYGPSIPTMMGVTRRPELTSVGGKDRMVPVLSHGVSLISIGFFVEPAQAVVWRGPMLHKALQQFLEDVHWGELDYLIVDVPPGTGDVHISLAGFIKPTGAVLVTTPQTVALDDVIRGRNMFQNVKVPVLGLIENMSWFVCDGCGKQHAIFSRGGGRKAAERLEVPFLGEIPIYTSIRESCDEGVPIVLREPEGPAALAINAVVDGVVERISRRAVEAEGEQHRLRLV